MAKPSAIKHVMEMRMVSFAVPLFGNKLSEMLEMIAKRIIVTVVPTTHSRTDLPQITMMMPRRIKMVPFRIEMALMNFQNGRIVTYEQPACDSYFKYTLQSVELESISSRLVYLPHFRSS